MVPSPFRLALRAVAAAALLGCAALARPADARAQESAPLVASDTLLEVRLADGSVVYGRIVSAGEGRLVIQTAAGARIEVDRAQVRSARAVRGAERQGQVWFDDPHRDRLFIGPTGRSLPAGEGFFGVYELFVPVVSYGVTDWLSITGGVPVVPGAIGNIAYVEPKVRVPLGPASPVQLSAGASVFFDTQGEGAAGLLYGAGTYGGEDHALHVAASFPFLTGGGDDVEVGEEPVIMLGGETRVSRRIKLLSENYILPESGVVSIAGVRIFGERLSADAGLGILLGDDCSECILPVVNFAYTFGGGRSGERKGTGDARRRRCRGPHGSRRGAAVPFRDAGAATANDRRPSPGAREGDAFVRHDRDRMAGVVAPEAGCASLRGDARACRRGGPPSPATCPPAFRSVLARGSQERVRGYIFPRPRGNGIRQDQKGP